MTPQEKYTPLGSTILAEGKYKNNGAVVPYCVIRFEPSAFVQKFNEQYGTEFPKDLQGLNGSQRTDIVVSILQKLYREMQNSERVVELLEPPARLKVEELAANSAAMNNIDTIIRVDEGLPRRRQDSEFITYHGFNVS